MAPKRPSPLDEPPAASSSEEEQTSSGEEEEEEEEEEEGGSSEGEEDEEDKPEDKKSKKTAALTPSSPVTDKKGHSKKPDTTVTSQPQSTSSESGSESNSDSDTESGQNVQPIASKPMDETPNSKKATSKPSASIITPARSAAKKASESVNNSKRAKKKSSEVDTEDDSKKTGEESKKLFQRLWSEDDEIAILKGMIDYSEMKGTDPALDMNAFHDFVKKSLHVDVSKVQVMDKIRRLKKKYNNNVGRGKKGQDPTFTKPHEQKAYELSKKIWGVAGTSRKSDQPKANGTRARKKQKQSTSRSLDSELISTQEAVEDEDKTKIVMDRTHGSYLILNELIDFDKKIGTVGLSENVVTSGWELIGELDREEAEQEFRDLQRAEFELFHKRTTLISKVSKMILEAHRNK